MKQASKKVTYNTEQIQMGNDSKRTQLALQVGGNISRLALLWNNYCPMWNSLWNVVLY